MVKWVRISIGTNVPLANFRTGYKFNIGGRESKTFSALPKFFLTISDKLSRITINDIL